MLSVCVYINGKQVAEATARNLSDLADRSDYEITVEQSPNQDLGIPRLFETGHIREHYRRQSAWALVEQMARFAVNSQK